MSDQTQPVEVTSEKTETTQNVVTEKVDKSKYQVQEDLPPQLEG
jgi:hypothetical protein